MASISEVLVNAGLNDLEKSSYNNVIDIAKVNGTSRKINFNYLSDYIQDRLNRQNALYDAIDTKYQESGIVDDYSLFSNIVARTRTQSEELDTRNGMISMVIFGDIKAQRMRQREIAEMSLRQDLILWKAVETFDTFSANMDDLKDQIPD